MTNRSIQAIAENDAPLTELPKRKSRHKATKTMSFSGCPIDYLDSFDDLVESGKFEGTFSSFVVAAIGNELARMR